MQVGAVTQSGSHGEIPQLTTDRADVDVESLVKSTWKTCRCSPEISRISSFSHPERKSRMVWSHAATENPQGGGQIFVNGQHFSGTNFELDGTITRTRSLGILW